VAIKALLGHVCSFESSKVAQIIQRAKDVLGGIRPIEAHLKLMLGERAAVSQQRLRAG